MPDIDNYKVTNNNIDGEVDSSDELIEVYKSVANESMLAIKSGIAKNSAFEVGYDLTVRPNTDSVATIEESSFVASSALTSGSSTIVVDEIVLANKPIRLPNPSVTPPTGGNGLSIHPNNKYVAFGHTSSPYFSIYEYNPTTGEYGAKSDNPSSALTSSVTSVAFHPSGNWIAVTQSGTPFFYVYAFDSATGVIGARSSNPSVLPTAPSNDITFHPNGNFILLCGTSSPFINIYAFNSSTGVIGAKSANPATLPASGNDVAFHPNGNFFAVTYSTTSPYMSIYPFNSTTGVIGTRIANPSVLPTAINNVVFHPNGNFIAVAVSNAVFSGAKVIVYQFNSATGEVGTKIADPVFSPGLSGLNVQFSNSGKYLVLGSSQNFVKPEMMLIYSFNDSTGDIGDYRSVPLSPNGVGFTNDDKYMVVVAPTSPYIYSYSFSTPNIINSEFIIYDDTNYERKIITGIDIATRTLTLNAPLTNSYKAKTLIARSSSKLMETTSLVNNQIEMTGWGFNSIPFGKRAPYATGTTPSTGNYIAHHPSGNWVAVASGASSFIGVYAFDTATGTIGTRTSTGGTVACTSIAFHPSGNFLGVSHSGSPYFSIYPFNPSTAVIGTRITSPGTLPTSLVNHISFSPSGKFICVTGTSSPNVYVYPMDTTTGAIGVKVANPSFIPTAASMSSFHPSETYLAIGCPEIGGIAVYPFNSTTGAMGTAIRYSVASTINNGDRIAFNSGGNYIAIAGSVSPYLINYPFNGTTLDTPKSALNIPAAVTDLRVHPTNDTILLYSSVSVNANGYNNPLSIFKVDSSGEFKIFADPMYNTSGAKSATFSVNGNHICALFNDTTLISYTFNYYAPSSLLVEDVKYNLKTTGEYVTIYIEHSDIADANYIVEGSLSSEKSGDVEVYYPMSRKYVVTNGVKEVNLHGNIRFTDNVIAKLTITRSDTSYNASITKILTIPV